MSLLLVGMAWFVSLAGSNLTQESPKALDAACTFQDGKQISLRYETRPGDNEELPIGRVYSPGGSPMFLFTQTGLITGDIEIPAGAFSMYLIPEKKKWSLVINRKVSSGPYDEKQDLVRMPMQIGHLGAATQGIRILFVHVAPKQCNMRVYYRQTGAWVSFKEK